MFTQQLTRIKDKLPQVKAKDKDFKVFGSNYHRYEFHPPLTVHEVNQFEQENRIELPLDFIAFITTIGNGGPGYFGAAGPYYGIYALGNLGYMVGCKNTMALPCLINTQLTLEQWQDATKFDDEGDNQLEDEREFDQKYDMLFRGLLPIGTQGCNFQTMLILNGDDRGRIVGIDQDLQMPIIYSDKSFLDWYERWLDRILNNK